MAKKKRRKLTKAEAKELALRKQRQRRITWALAGVGAVAVAVVLILIAVSGGGGATVDVEPLRDDVETGVTAEGYPYRGPADAPVTIVELSDYNCPICGDFALNTFPQIDEELIATGQVKYVIQPFALWQESVPVVEAAACARDQGAFWDFHHRIFADQSRFSRTRPPSMGMLRAWAEASGLDVQAFEACLDEGRFQAQVLEATREGKAELEVQGTPTFFVNGVKTQLMRGEAYIDTIRNAVQAAQAAGSNE